MLAVSYNSEIEFPILQSYFEINRKIYIYHDLLFTNISHPLYIKNHSKI